ncbi:MAG: thiamine pyrophosphate-binding protein [Deltaproteobacteria bacterium]|nr:thiamine pyrophosphate-binding protein [Deltaproteobacteria bacterium]
MDWPQKITTMLKRYQVQFINYVPDAIGEKLLKLMREDRDFHLVPLTREEEGVGIAAGQAICGKRPLLLMPTSGFGNAMNAIASLNIPYRIPLPMIIGLRGALGEFNPTQVMMGQALPQMLDAMRIPHFEIQREDEVEVLTEGFLRVCYSTESPAALILTTQLAGWKE